MKIDSFIFNWKGHEANAHALELKIGKFTKVTVINSEEHLRDKHPGWAHLNDQAYFSAQWNEACRLFDGDILFHIQADAYFDQFETLFAKVRLLFQKYPIGVYEPNVDYTSIRYNKLRLRAVEPDLLEVPKTDCTCWFISKDVVKQLPLVDVTVNKYGWGIPRAIAAVSHLSGRRCVRDYNVTIRHPKGRGYSTEEAKLHLRNYLESLDPEVKQEISRIDKISVQLAP